MPSTEIVTVGNKQCTFLLTWAAATALQTALLRLLPYVKQMHAAEWLRGVHVSICAHAGPIGTWTGAVTKVLIDEIKLLPVNFMYSPNVDAALAGAKRAEPESELLKGAVCIKYMKGGCVTLCPHGFKHPDGLKNILNKDGKLKQRQPDGPPRQHQQPQRFYQNDGYGGGQQGGGHYANHNNGDQRRGGQYEQRGGQYNHSGRRG